MAETSGPFGTGTFNSMADTVWQQFAKLFVTTGVHPSLLNKLVVTAGAGLSVNVDTGYAIVEGCFYHNDASLNKTLSSNSSGNPRIDRIVLRLDNTGKVCSVQVLTGTPGGSPVAPTLTQTVTTYEISLAQVAVANGASAPGTITDERSVAVTCGYAGAWAMGTGHQGVGSGLDADTVDGLNSSAFALGNGPSQHIIVLNRAPTNSDGVDGDIIFQW